MRKGFVNTRWKIPALASATAKPRKQEPITHWTALARRSVSRLAVALAAVLWTGCLFAQPTAVAKKECCTEAEVARPLTDRSLYQLESVWTNDLGRPVRLTALRGRPQLVVMFFASCQYACPALVHDLKRIESALPEPVRAQTGIALVSFDSARDTAPALAAYRERHQLPPERWTLLRGEAQDVLELAALLGVKYKQDAAGQFSHSNGITLLNAEGEIVHQQIGLNQRIDEIAAAVQALVPSDANDSLRSSDQAD